MKTYDLNDKKVLILVEGLTEQILLPALGKACGMDLITLGAVIIPAGGAKKLVHKYLYWKEHTNLPIFCLFDKDAQCWAAEISPQLRPQDCLHILADGEIEDSLQLEFFINQLNDYLTSDCLNDTSKLVCASDFIPNERRTLILEKIWRERQLGKFEKVKFAQFISKAMGKENTISADARSLFNKLATI